MGDLREPEDLLTRVMDAQRQLRRDGAVPPEARDLLRELQDALAESGPSEVRDWLAASIGR